MASIHVLLKCSLLWVLCSGSGFDQDGPFPDTTGCEALQRGLSGPALWMEIKHSIKMNYVLWIKVKEWEAKKKTFVYLLGSTHSTIHPNSYSRLFMGPIFKITSPTQGCTYNDFFLGGTMVWSVAAPQLLYMITVLMPKLSYCRCRVSPFLHMIILGLRFPPTSEGGLTLINCPWM